MAKRPFNPDALAACASDELRPPIGVGALVWRYTIFVPLEELRTTEAEPRLVADFDDLENLRQVLVQHFGGFTGLPPLLGAGLRDPTDATSLEIDKHLPFVVYARPLAAADRYFERLQQELQEALEQGLVLVERQEVFLLGQYRAAMPKMLASAAPPQPVIEGSTRPHAI
jgi:hypothetical protein